MSRVELEKQARNMGLEVDGKMSDQKLRDAIKEKGAETMAADDDHGEARFHEPQGEDRFIPVEEPGEFKPDAGMDKIKHKVKPAEKLFPVKLVKNYRPISPDFQIQGEGGVYRSPNDEERLKVPAGQFISLPVAEAQSVIEKEIAKRNDPIR